MYLKILIILFSLLYQNTAHSKATEKNQFNQKYLSNYFSALVSVNNQKNDDAIIFFNSSKFLMNKHDNFLREYVFSLVLGGQVKNAINQIKRSNNSNFFEGDLLLALESITKKNYKQAEKRLKKLLAYQENEAYEFVIIKILESYNHLFLNSKIKKNNRNLGRIDLITNSFQNCYLGTKKTDSNFLNLINSSENEYSRYLFFHLSNIIEKKDYELVNEISKTIDPLMSSLLIAQSKKWIEENKYEKFNNYFSCKSENDLLAEFFFLIANLYSSQDLFKESNFYLNISNYLNPKFYFNLSLLAENYFVNKKYGLAEKIYKKFDKKDIIYQWYQNKQIAKIIEKQKNKKSSLNYIENKFKSIKNPNIKILFDMANIYKGFREYKKSIKYYSIVLSKLEENSEAYADVLYRRGGSYERIQDYENSDKDMLKSLEIRKDDPYVMNYLAYSWLEREYEISKAIEMLNVAYSQKQDDPYIIDSVGWGYYLIGDYVNAEKYIQQAVLLMPEDPIVNDHYGDILWMLDRKIQAKYFWKNVLNLEDTEPEMKKKILQKLTFGPEKS